MLLLCSCLFGVFISHSGASVSLVIDGGLSSFQDGTDVILICTISPYNNVMTWFVDNDPYADCFLGSCGATPNKPYTFIFNFDESNGEFRLTIESVNSSHAGLLFACDDGNERKTKSFHVTTKDEDQNNKSISNTTITTVGQSEPSDWLCRTWDGKCIGLINGCIIIAFLWLIGFIRSCYNCCCKKNMSEKDDYINCINVLLCIPIIGVIVVIILILDRKTCGLPHQPKDLKVAENGTTDTSIKVQWTEGFDGGCKQNFYVYVNGNEQKVDYTCKRGNIWSYTCTCLTPGSWYDIEIKAKNRKGWSASCHAKYRTTGKPDPPTKFRIAYNGITDNSIMVEWKPGYNGGYCQTFFVYYKGRGHEVKSSPIDGKYSFKCEHLEPGSTYEIVLHAKNIKGNADYCILDKEKCKTKGRRQRSNEDEDFSDISIET